MSRMYLFLMILILGLIYNSESFGQTRKNLNEVSIAGSINVESIRGHSATSISLTTGYGHFVTKFLELGGNFGLTKSKYRDALGAVSFFVSLHLSSKPDVRTVPFIMGQVGFGYGLDDNPDIAGGAIGIKSFVSGGGGAITTQLFYQLQGFDFIQIENYGVSTGVSIFF